MKRALVIDGSIFARRNFTTVLKKAGYEVTTASSARNGLRLADSIDPEIVTLDIGIEDMNGLDCLQALRSDSNRPVVVTAEPGEHTQALAAAVRRHGAAAAIAKPQAWDIVHNARGVDDLISTISRAALQTPTPPAKKPEIKAPPLKQPTPRQRSVTGQVSATPERVPRQYSFRPAGPNFPIYLVGSSTGGPNALQEILTKLTADFPAAIVIAQHMPKRFTQAFAKRLDGLIAMQVHEVAEATEVKPGNCYIAAGGTDCIFSARTGRVNIAPAAPEDGSLWCPSVDRLVSTAMRTLPPKRLRGIQLTGIGNDGAKSMKELHSKGSLVIAESKESSVVFGMPGNLIAMGGASKVLHRQDIGAFLMETVQR